MGYVRLWNGHQSKGANNWDVLDCWRGGNSTAGHSALVEIQATNVRVFPVLGCLVWRFMIYWVTMHSQAYSDQPVPYDHVHRSRTSTLSALGRSREGKSHFWLEYAKQIPHSLNQYNILEQKLLPKSSTWYITISHLHCNFAHNKLLKYNLVTKGKRNYNGVSILIKHFFSSDFMLLFLTKIPPKPQSSRLDIRDNSN